MAPGASCSRLTNTRILGIESSCDETAAAVVENGSRILSSVVSSQIATHAKYGGVVPELASREHLRAIVPAVRLALEQSATRLEDLQAIAVTQGPGLVGSLLVGITYAKALAFVHKLPLIGVNHIEGHIHAVVSQNRDGQDATGVSRVEYPALALVVSGGHTHLYEIREDRLRENAVLEGFRYRLLGRTRDDAAGEAFDKCAKLLGLGYPGGAALEDAARAGNPKRFALPRPLLGRPGCDFSFSGLKTAVRSAIESRHSSGAEPGRQDVHRQDVRRQDLDRQDVADLAASFQGAIADVLADRTAHALETFSTRHPDADILVVAGGVAANRTLRRRLEAVASEAGFRFLAPPPHLCTDNAAMIAWAGIERLKLGLVDQLDFAPRPRWPLDPAAPAAIGAGVKA